MNKILSISIPTYNRKSNLNILLDFLLYELNRFDPQKELVEIVITDNASTDGTALLMKEYIQRDVRIKYFENDKNYGIDENIARAVENATGKYVHLMSDDDCIEPGFHEELTRFLNLNELNFLFLNAAIKNLDGSINYKKKIINASKLNKENFGYIDKNQFLDELGVWITFISSFVVNRSAWLSIVNHRRFVGTDIYLSYVALNIVANDDGGYLYHPVAIHVRPHFSGSYRIYRAFTQEWRKLILHECVSLGFNRDLLRRVFEKSVVFDIPNRIINSKIKGALNSKDIMLVFFNTFDYAKSWVFIYPLIFIPSAFFRLAQKIRKIFK
jgi:glycosyltransferase involved in cell wall biosynthesis